MEVCSGLIFTIYKLLRDKTRQVSDSEMFNSHEKLYGSLPLLILTIDLNVSTRSEVKSHIVLLALKFFSILCKIYNFLCNF